MTPKFPKTVRLLDGREVKVVHVNYQMGRGIWRIEYEGRKGCLAEIFPDRFEEVIPKSYKEQDRGR